MIYQNHFSKNLKFFHFDDVFFIFVRSVWNLNLPFLLLASGDYSNNLLTDQSLIILDKEYKRAPHPLGMFKSIKVRGESMFSLRKTEDQWAKSLNYLKEHLYLVLSNPELSEGLQSNLLFPADLD